LWREEKVFCFLFFYPVNYFSFTKNNFALQNLFKRVNFLFLEEGVVIQNGIWHSKSKVISFPGGFILKDPKDGIWKKIPSKEAKDRRLVNLDNILDQGRVLSEDNLIEFLNHHLKK